MDGKNEVSPESIPKPRLNSSGYETDITDIPINENLRHGQTFDNDRSYVAYVG